MLEKDHDYDEYFPAMMYRMGKNVPEKKAYEQSFKEYISHKVFRQCYDDGRQEDIFTCYKEHLGIMRELIAIVNRKL